MFVRNAESFGDRISGGQISDSFNWWRRQFNAVADAQGFANALDVSNSRDFVVPVSIFSMSALHLPLHISTQKDQTMGSSRPCGAPLVPTVNPT